MSETRLWQKVLGQLQLAKAYEGTTSVVEYVIRADLIQTHEISEQKLVAQLTSREQAEAHHFAPEEDVQVKEEPEESGMVNVQLHQDETELVNGSIVFDENGQAYRYYTSESEYQAAHGVGRGGSARPLQASVRQEANAEPTSAFPLGFRLDNAAPPTKTTFGMPEPAPVEGYSFPGGSWDRSARNPVMQGVDFVRGNLALGNAAM